MALNLFQSFFQVLTFSTFVFFADYTFVYSERLTGGNYEWSDGAPVTQFWCDGQPLDNNECLGMDTSLASYCPAGGLDDTTWLSPRPFISI